MKSMIFSCRFHRVCALPVPAEDDSSAGRALSPASVRSEPAWSTDDDDDANDDDDDDDANGVTVGMNCSVSSSREFPSV